VESGGRLIGADIDLARDLAHRLHAEPVFVRTSWSALLEDLNRGEFDMALGGISVTPPRQAAAAFSLPYASGGKTIISRCRDAARYRGLAAVDRPGVRVIVNPGGTNEQYVRANLHQAQLLLYADNRTIFDEISARRADVMITDDVEVNLQTRRHPDLCRAYAGTLTHADKAILLPRDPDLAKAVNGWLSEALAAGEPARLVQHYLDR
jgi:cyclohexadienyl dehydratase